MNTIEMSDTVLSAHELLSDLIRHYGDMERSGELSSHERVLLDRMMGLSGKLEEVSLNLCVDAVMDAVVSPSWSACSGDGKGV